MAIIISWDQLAGWSLHSKNLHLSMLPNFALKLLDESQLKWHNAWKAHIGKGKTEAELM